MMTMSALGFHIIVAHILNGLLVVRMYGTMGACCVGIAFGQYVSTTGEGCVDGAQPVCPGCMSVVGPFVTDTSGDILWY